MNGVGEARRKGEETNRSTVRCHHNIRGIPISLTGYSISPTGIIPISPTLHFAYSVILPSHAICLYLYHSHLFHIVWITISM